MELSLVYSLWLREIKRFFRMKSRLIGPLGLPVFFLIILGFAPIELPNASPGGYISFLAPGIIGMIILFASMGAGLSVLWDKEFGFLKEVLVAPVSRTSVAIGKTLSSTTIAMLQGILILLFAPIIGVSFSASTLLTLLPLMLLLAVSMSSMGILLATRIKSMQAFQVVMQMLMFPMIFLSGVFFPVEGLPAWMNVLVKINPATYGIAPIRQVILGTTADSPLGVTILGHTMSVWDNVAVVAVFGILMTVLSMWSFNHQD